MSASAEDGIVLDMRESQDSRWELTAYVEETGRLLFHRSNIGTKMEAVDLATKFQRLYVSEAFKWEVLNGWYDIIPL